MESLKEDNIHHTAMKLAEEIKNLSIYKSFYSDVQVSLIVIINVCDYKMCYIILIDFMINRNWYLHRTLKKKILSKLYNKL